MGVWQQFWRGVSGVFLRPICPLCQRSAQQWFCLDCERQLKDCRWPHPEHQWTGSLPVFSWGIYQPPLKQAIAQLKYSKQSQLARPLGHWLGESWLSSVGHNAPKLLVVPIPLHGDRLRIRGYNQAALLAEAFCEITQFPLISDGLVRRRATQAQYSLSAQGREQNLANAFSCGPSLKRRTPHRPILLLDDIYTTGITVRSAAQALQKQDFEVYGVAVVAHGKFDKPPAKMPVKRSLT